MGVLHDDAAAQLRAARDTHAGKQDAVRDRALDEAAVGNEAVFHMRVLAVIGADIRALLRAHRPLSREERGARQRFQHIHAGGEIVRDRVHAHSVARVQEHVHRAAARKIGKQSVAVEEGAVFLRAEIEHGEQHVLVDDVGLHGGKPRIGRGARDELRDAAVRIRKKAVVLTRDVPVPADGRDAAAARLMLRDGGGEVEIAHDVRRHEHDLRLRNGAHIGDDRVERLRRAGIVAVRVHTERRQQMQTPAAARQVPRLAAAEMVEQGLIVPLHDDADAVHARVGERRERKVDQPVAPAERQGCIRAPARQIAEPRRAAIRVNDTMNFTHTCTSAPS